MSTIMKITLTVGVVVLIAAWLLLDHWAQTYLIEIQPEILEIGG